MIPTADPVIAGLAKDSNMGSKPILESATDVLALPIATHPESINVRNARYVRLSLDQAMLRGCEFGNYLALLFGRYFAAILISMTG